MILKNFDYSSLPEPTRLELENLAYKARFHAQTAIHHAISLGKTLAQGKKLLEHGHFLEWAEQEIGVPKQEASRLINLYERFGEDPRFTSGEARGLSLSVLKLLAAPSTPETLSDSIIDEAVREGNQISLSETKELIAFTKEDGNQNLNLEELQVKLEAAKKQGFEDAETHFSLERQATENELAETKKLLKNLELQQASDKKIIDNLMNEHGKETLRIQAKKELDSLESRIANKRDEIDRLLGEEARVKANVEDLHENSYRYDLQAKSKMALELLKNNYQEFFSETKKSIETLSANLNDLIEPEVMNYLKNTGYTNTASDALTNYLPRIKKESELVYSQLADLHNRFSAFYGDLDKIHHITNFSNIDWNKINRVNKNGNGSSEHQIREIEILPDNN